MKIVEKRATCRLCDSKDLNLLIEMPEMPPVDNYRRMGESEIAIPNLPMDLYMCKACGHAQLLDVVDPNVLFGNYIYTSSSSPDLDDHFSGFVKRMTEYLDLSGNERILDIGCNDGLLLEKFKDLGYEVVGMDPSKYVADIAIKRGIDTYVSYFNNESTKMLQDKHGKFDLITACNVFSHADDLTEFAQCVENLLSDNGVFVYEVSYLLDLVQKRVLDYVYHEHLCHHSVSPLRIFMEKCNLKLINVDRLEVKGGSIRCYAVKATNAKKPEKIIDQMIDSEIQEGLYKPKTYQVLSQEFQNLKLKVKSEIHRELMSGNKIAAYGASATSTVLNYLLDINPHLSYIVDDNKLRQGRLSPGYMIPVKSSSSLLIDKPSIVVISAWRFADIIIDVNQSYLDAGGSFLIPLPNFEIISQDSH